jgi:hypothetical protein
MSAIHLSHLKTLAATQTYINLVYIHAMVGLAGISEYMEQE